nr:uncharacterized protein CI109_003024 [Kwoniella shandongensis]KAA5528492.1 hypothetical protein CI109_003024 [Kwoniella shandongensis]
MPSILTTTLAAFALLAALPLRVSAAGFIGCTSQGYADSISYGENLGNSVENCIVYDLTTTFEFRQCLSNMVTDNAPPNTNTIKECFQACATEGSAMINPLGNGQFGCRCNAPNVIEVTSNGFAVNCNAGTWFNYVHTAEAQASGLARRRARATLEQLRLDSQTLCPKGLTACNVNEYSDTYECIDTKNELEACGGCIFGEFQNTSANITLGVDCTTVAGVAFGAITCMDSQCTAFSCEKGYELVAGSCVATY